VPEDGPVGPVVLSGVSGMTSEMAGDRRRAWASAGLTEAVMESTRLVVASTLAPPAFSAANTRAWAGQAAPGDVLVSGGQVWLSTSMTF
jgi:hypothetical protein